MVTGLGNSRAVERRTLIVSAVFAALYAICFHLAFLLRFDFVLEAHWKGVFWATLPFVVLAKLVASWRSGQFRRTLRYISLTDAILVTASMVIATVVTYLLNRLDILPARIPRSVVLIDGVLAVVATCLFRSSIRVHREIVRPWWERRERIRTVIHGAGATGIATVRALRSTALEFDVVAFLEDCPLEAETRLGEIPVYSSSRGLEEIARRLGIERVLISSSTRGERIRAIFDRCAELGLEAKVIPNVREFVDGRAADAVRNVRITDLLKREPARLDRGSIDRFLCGRRVLVTGAAGSIGSEICRQVLRSDPACLILVDQSEGAMFHLEQELIGDPLADRLVWKIADVTDKTWMREIFEEQEPELVFHAAAYKHVPLMQTNPRAAIRNNVVGTKVVADLADQFAATGFVLISTDKAVDPSSVMGATKRMAERYVQALSQVSKTRFLAVRFGNVLDSAGSVVPTFREQIERGGPITVTHPQMTRYFMTIPEAVQLVLQAGAAGASGDVLILEMGEPVRIVDLAKTMIRLSGLKHPEDVDIVYTGIRPGEKLVEALIGRHEEAVVRIDDNLLSVRGRTESLLHLNQEIAELLSQCSIGDAAGADALMRLVAGDPPTEAAASQAA